MSSEQAAAKVLCIWPDRTEWWAIEPAVNSVTFPRRGMLRRRAFRLRRAGLDEVVTAYVHPAVSDYLAMRTILAEGGWGASRA